MDRHTWNGREFSHLVGESLPELHAFARALPCSRKWFHNKPGRPHYDLYGRCIEEALRRGAKLVTTRQLLMICDRHYRQS